MCVLNFEQPLYKVLIILLIVLLAWCCGRRWSSNPSRKCSYERPTRGTVCGTMRSMCGADAAYLAINCNLHQVLIVLLIVLLVWFCRRRKQNTEVNNPKP